MGHSVRVTNSAEGSEARVGTHFSEMLHCVYYRLLSARVSEPTALATSTDSPLWGSTVA